MLREYKTQPFSTFRHKNDGWLIKTRAIALVIHCDLVTNFYSIPCLLYARQSLALAINSEAPTCDIRGSNSRSETIARLIFPLLQDLRHNIDVFRRVEDSIQLLFGRCAQNALCALIGVKHFESYEVII